MKAPRLRDGLITAGALLLAACGGSDVAGTGASDAGSSTSAPAATVAADSAHPTPSVAATASAEPAAAVEPRADGLTGAPVSPPTSQSSEFAADRVNARAGTFPPPDFPEVVLPVEATWMEPDDLVLGALHNGEARAYPLFMMTLHHVSNDWLGGEPYLATF